MTKETNVTKLETVEPKGSFEIFILFTDESNMIFEDILGYQIGSHWAAVSLKDGSTFAFPTTTICSIKHYPTPITKE